ncbi:MAG: DUF4351 domain-containing protein, partial [Acidobacteriota bacterium]
VMGKIGKRLADKLVKVWLTDGAEVWVMIHVEVQGQQETGFELRIYVYNHRIFERYNAPVASFVILTDDNPDWRPAEHRQELFGTETIFRFRAVKLLDFEARWAEMEASSNVFAVVAMAHLRVISTKRDFGTRLDWKLHLTKLLYEKGYDKLTVLKLFRFLDWLIWLPEDLQRSYDNDLDQYEEEKRMTYVTNVERRRLREGLQQGLQQGSCRQLLRVLSIRFGQSAEDLRDDLAKLDVEQLDAMTTQALSAQSLPDFIAALPKTNGSSTNATQTQNNTSNDIAQ